MGTLIPSSASAGVFADFFASIRGDVKTEEATPSVSTNVQTMTLLKPALNIDPVAGRGGGDITIVDDSALMAEEGPSGTIADIERAKSASISLYVVRRGDTLSGIAKLFDVSINTIVWANDLSRSESLKVGQMLTILPVTGVSYTVKKGDTLASVAKKFGGDAGEIASFNDVGNVLQVGTDIIIPNGEVAVSVAASPARTQSFGSGIQYIGYYVRPIIGGTRTQGIHGYNGVDIASPVGTPIIASASGDVIISKEGGWNGGYGNYVVVRHPNGTQTLYSHNLRNAVGIGEYVVQGQIIAYIGATGRTTGPHVHFEIRNGPRNPF
ncbi:MAG TPA: M23 family metallopeptidase [Candidatus Paceibacterota bacterium]